MQSSHFAKRSLAASCVLHLLAITGLASWTASKQIDRTRFAGQSEVIELLATRADTYWSPEPLAFDAVVDEVPVTVEPTTVRIARKQFDHLNASEFAFDKLVSEASPVASQIEFAVAKRSHLEASDAPANSSALRPVTLPRRHLQARELQAATVQPPQMVGADRSAPSFTTSPPPTYPTVAIQNSWEGTVLLRVHIDKAGVVDEVEVARTSGYPALDGAAVNAVRRWRGTPATQNGRSISTTELLPVRFKLRG